MSVPAHNLIKLGTAVSIVLKQDQRTGKQVQGKVQDVLTRGNHPRGVKVRLQDGRIGRVQRLLDTTTKTEANTSTTSKKYTVNPARVGIMDNNPWADSAAPSRTNQQPQSYSQPYSQQSQYQAPAGPPPPSSRSDQQHYSSRPQQADYSITHSPEQPDFNAWSDTSGNPPLPQRNNQAQYQSQTQPQSQSYPQQSQYTDSSSPYQQQHHPMPGNFGAYNNSPQRPIRRSSTEDLVPDQQDRSEQVEHMQEFEANARESQADRDRRQLEKEYPNVDGSLIAALYSDTQSLADTREMLQELASS